MLVLGTAGYNKATRAARRYPTFPILAGHLFPLATHFQGLFSEFDAAAHSSDEPKQFGHSALAGDSAPPALAIPDSDVPWVACRVGRQLGFTATLQVRHSYPGGTVHHAKGLCCS